MNILKKIIKIFKGPRKVTEEAFLKKFGPEAFVVFDGSETDDGKAWRSLGEHVEGKKQDIRKKNPGTIVLLSTKTHAVIRKNGAPGVGYTYQLKKR